MKRLRHPVRAIRDPFGTAGLIVACIALVLALTGAAFAAGKLTSKQKKEVEKIAKKYAGKPGAPGAAGPQGPAGSNGQAGAKGDAGTNGTNGVDGKSVIVANEAPAGCAAGGFTYEIEGSGNENEICNGKNGQTGFTETLPSGKTETGVWGINLEPSKATIVPISLNIPLETAPEAIFVTGGSASGCPGFAGGLPTAEAGKLCIYALPGLGTLSGSPTFFNPTELSLGAGKDGVAMSLTCGGSSTCVQYGSYAVTAP